MLPHVVIAGGGVGALEGLLALQSLAPASLRISVLTGSRHLTYRALSTSEPFGGDPPPRFGWDDIARDGGVRWIPDVLVAVRPEVRELETRDGPAIGYDALLLALGDAPPSGHRSPP
jgi:NADH dehydrogenase FAD-containing subunit